MKNIKKGITLLFLSIVLLNSCSNSNKNFEEFLTNFEEKTEFPLKIKADSTGNQLNNLKEIDEKFLSLFVDTTGLFEIIDGVKTCDTHYYYYVKIDDENSNFYTLIIAHKMAEFIRVSYDNPLIYKIYTFSKNGELIETQEIASGKWSVDSDFPKYGYSSVVFNNSKQFEVKEIENTQDNSIKITTQYSINEDGTIAEGQKTDETEVLNNIDFPLYNIFVELVNSEKIYFEYNLNGFTKDVEDYYGREVFDRQENDFIFMKFWAAGGALDTICLQKLKNDDLYILWHKEQCEMPRNFENSITFFQKLKNGQWDRISSSDYFGEDFGIFCSYAPYSKIITDYDIEEDEEALIGYKPTKQKSKYVWSETEGKFIKEEISELPNPIIVTIDITSPSEYANYSDATIVPNHYFYDELKGKTSIRFAVEYQLAENQEIIKASDRMMTDIIKNTDTNKKFFIKYKTVKIMESEGFSEPYEVDAKIIEDYEVITAGDIVVTFKDYIMSDLPIYTFTSRLGYDYEFDGINDSKYQFEKGDAPNPEYIGKKFKIHFTTSEEKDDYNDRMVEYNIIDKIEIIEN